MPVKKGLSKGAKIGIAAASIFTLGTVAALTIWGVKSKSNKGPEDTGPGAGGQDINKKIIENQDVVDLGENKKEKKNIIKISNANVVSTNQDKKEEQNSIKDISEFLKKSEQKIEAYNSLLVGMQNVLGTDFGKQKMVDFKEKVIKDIKEIGSVAYLEKFNKMLEAIKSHQFSEKEKSELEELLQIVKDNKINSSLITDFYNGFVTLQLQDGALYYLELRANDFVIEKSVDNNTKLKITLNY